MSSDLTTSTDNHIFSFHPIALESIKYGRGALSKESTTYSVDLHYSTNTTFTTKKSLNPLPYGEVWFSEGSEDFAPKYNSQELDKESDLYYFNARHYDPELARFVSADVVIPDPTYSQSWNRYMYVAGNPIMYKDPTGHLWEELWEKLGNLFDGKRYNTDAQVISNQNADFKQQLVDSVNDQYKDWCTPLRARTGTVRVDGKDVVINFTERFSYGINRDTPGGIRPEEVIANLDNRVLGSVIRAASQSNIDEVTISGLGRKSSTSLHGTNDAVDIASVGRKNAKGKIEQYAFLGKEGESTTLSKPATSFRDALKKNIPAGTSNAELFDPNAFFRRRDDKILTDGANVGAGLTEQQAEALKKSGKNPKAEQSFSNQHKNHLHFGFR